MPTVNNANRNYYPNCTNKNNEIRDIFSENRKIDGAHDEILVGERNEVLCIDKTLKKSNEGNGRISKSVESEEWFYNKEESENKECNFVINGSVGEKDIDFFSIAKYGHENDSGKNKLDQINITYQHVIEKTLEKKEDNESTNTSTEIQNKLKSRKCRNKLIVIDNAIKTKTEKHKKERRVEIKNTKRKINKQVKRRKEDNTKLRLNSGILVTLVFLNVTGHGIAVEVLSTNSLAYLLGYPVTCSLGGEVSECTLSLACWLRGGIRHAGCGGWLFSCCGHPQDSENSLPTDWSHQVSPPRLRNVPQRNVMPNNVFRRRVDDDAAQMECGVPSSRFLQKRIIGGREARPAEFPWQAHVRISEFQCGGVLVSQSYVATAAHCVSRAHIRDIVVWLGALDTSVGSHTAQKVGVHKKILHPLFQFRMTQPDRYDIALLQLSRTVAFSPHILAICLPEAPMELRGRSAVIAGWGKTDATDTHTGTNMLRSATVPILSKEQCIAWHQSKQILVEIHSEMICAGHSDGHQDACLGDSGGPLIVPEGGRYYLVGITSAGFGCGVDHQPGIYHNVQLTARWIRSVLRAERMDGRK